VNQNSQLLLMPPLPPLLLLKQWPQLALPTL
jgi:hypothetical protein